MKRKEYLYGNDAREATKKVAMTIGGTVGKTLGPAGRDFQVPLGITNDGATIIENLRFENECEDNVALAFHELARRIDSDAGDGTTTGTVIAAKIIEDVVPQIPDLDAPSPGAKSVMEISRELDIERDKALAILEKKAIPVTSLEELEQVAFTSMENKEAAKIVAKTIFEAGKDALTVLAEGFTGKLETLIQAGVEMPLQVAAPFMYNKGAEAFYEGEVPVLVANHIFEDYKETRSFMESMLDFLQKEELNISALVIVGKQFSIPFVQAVKRVYAGSKGGMPILLLSNPHAPDEMFDDIAAFVDATNINTHPRVGGKIEDAQFKKHCGMVSKIVATPKGAVFYGGNGAKLEQKKKEAPTTRVVARVFELKQQLEKETDAKKRGALERRIAEFEGGKATIYFDAKTAVEKFHLKLKVQDCMNSCKTALMGGRVRGGGLTLKEVAEELGEDSILFNALMAPYKLIQSNAGGSLEIAPDVFDSYLVAKAGIENAVSVVKTVIRIEGIIADTPRSLVDDLQHALTAA